jgi:hypothetical protein
MMTRAYGPAVCPGARYRPSFRHSPRDPGCGHGPASRLKARMTSKFYGYLFALAATTIISQKENG